jgi:hypothetical protein
MQSELRRRQILDDDTEKARFDSGAPGATSAPGNGRDSPQAEDGWVNSFIGRLAALVRDVSGRQK